MNSSMAAALAVGLMVAASAVAASVGKVAAAEDCSSVLTDLLDCLPYVSNGSNTSSPSAGCCIGVADVVIGSPTCICDALKQARELGVELNTSRVLGLPAACEVKAPEMRCGGGEIPPASSPLPSKAPTPAPQSSEAPSSPPPSPISAPSLTPTGSPPAPPPPAPSTEEPSPSQADAPASDAPFPSDAPQPAASLLLLLAAFAVTSAFN